MGLVMQTQKAPIEITRRFSCVSTTSHAKKITSDEIAQQVAEFEQRGGKISTIPTGINTLSYGQVVVSEEAHSMAIPRNSKKNKRTTTAPNSPFITVIEAAELAGLGKSTIAHMIKKGKLVAQKKEGCRAHFLKRVDVLALKKSLQKGNE